MLPPATRIIEGPVEGLPRCETKVHACHESAVTAACPADEAAHETLLMKQHKRLPLLSCYATNRATCWTSQRRKLQPTWSGAWRGSTTTPQQYPTFSQALAHVAATCTPYRVVKWGTHIVIMLMTSGDAGASAPQQQKIDRPSANTRSTTQQRLHSLVKNQHSCPDCEESAQQEQAGPSASRERATQQQQAPQVNVFALVMRCHALEPTVFQVLDMATRLYKPLLVQRCAAPAASGTFGTAY